MVLGGGIMSASNFNLRGIPEDLMGILKKEAKKLHISVNSLILKILEKGLGASFQVKRPLFHDLDHLAGTWSEEDAKKFKEETKFFEQIDEGLWE